MEVQSTAAYDENDRVLYGAAKLTVRTEAILQKSTTFCKINFIFSIFSIYILLF